MIRQGDILLIPVNENSVPGEYEMRPLRKTIIGLGEVSGHTHTLEKAQWLIDACEDLQQFAATGQSDNPVFVNVSKETSLQHQEHDTLIVPAGVYEIRRQREYTPEQIRFVAD